MVQVHLGPPHIHAGQASAIVAEIDSADPPEPVHFDIQHVALIEMRRDNRMYEWRIIASASIAAD